MYTPQQIEEISFGKATFGGYDVQSVDEKFGKLADDYITLYKENALLKSKMRVLVAKLEEYRNSEESMKDAIVNAQKSCDIMIKETEAKCTQMLAEANATAAENAKNAQAMIDAENQRVNEARRVSADQIDQIVTQLGACIQALNRIKAANPAPIGSSFYDYDREPDEDPAAAVAAQIADSLKSIIGTTDETPAPADGSDGDADDATPKFDGLADNFGPNYNPTAK